MNQKQLHDLAGHGEGGVAAEGRMGVVGEAGLDQEEGFCYMLNRDRGRDGPVTGEESGSEMESAGMESGAEMEFGTEMGSGAEMESGTVTEMESGAEMEIGTEMESGAEMESGTEMESGAEVKQGAAVAAVRMENAAGELDYDLQYLGGGEQCEWCEGRMEGWSLEVAVYVYQKDDSQIGCGWLQSLTESNPNTYIEYHHGIGLM